MPEVTLGYKVCTKIGQAYYSFLCHTLHYQMGVKRYPVRPDMPLLLFYNEESALSFCAVNESRWESFSILECEYEAAQEFIPVKSDYLGDLLADPKREVESYMRNRYLTLPPGTVFANWISLTKEIKVFNGRTYCVLA